MYLSSNLSENMIGSAWITNWYSQSLGQKQTKDANDNPHDIWNFVLGIFPRPAFQFLQGMGLYMFLSFVFLFLL